MHYYILIFNNITHFSLWNEVLSGPCTECDTALITALKYKYFLARDEGNLPMERFIWFVSDAADISAFISR